MTLNLLLASDHDSLALKASLQEEDEVKNSDDLQSKSTVSLKRNLKHSFK